MENNSELYEEKVLNSDFKFKVLGIPRQLNVWEANTLNPFKRFICKLFSINPLVLRHYRYRFLFEGRYKPNPMAIIMDRNGVKWRVEIVDGNNMVISTVAPTYYPFHICNEYVIMYSPYLNN